MQVRLSDSVASVIRKIAYEEGRSASFVASNALEQYLKHRRRRVRVREPKARIARK